MRLIVVAPRQVDAAFFMREHQLNPHDCLVLNVGSELGGALKQLRGRYGDPYVTLPGAIDFKAYLPALHELEITGAWQIPTEHFADFLHLIRGA